MKGGVKRRRRNKMRNRKMKDRGKRRRRNKTKRRK